MYLQINKLKIFFERIRQSLLISNQAKIFVLGLNGTGTTSMQNYLQLLGHTLGNQAEAEKLIPDYNNDNWPAIFDYINTAQAFADAPFSFPKIHEKLFNRYPNAKFILTVRDDAETWGKSRIRFLTKALKGDLSYRGLMSFEYSYPNFAIDVSKALSWNENIDFTSLQYWVQRYEQHNTEVVRFFHNKPNFIVINVNNKSDIQRLNKFLGQEDTPKFPHLNQTAR